MIYCISSIRFYILYNILYIIYYLFYIILYIKYYIYADITKADYGDKYPRIMTSNCTPKHGTRGVLTGWNDRQILILEERGELEELNDIRMDEQSGHNSIEFWTTNAGAGMSFKQQMFGFWTKRAWFSRGKIGMAAKQYWDLHDEPSFFGSIPMSVLSKMHVSPNKKCKQHLLGPWS